MTQTQDAGSAVPMPAQIEQMLNNAYLAEAATRVAIKEIHEVRHKLRRTEAAMALVLGSLVELKTPEGDYALHRLSQQLRLMAEMPDTAAQAAGCQAADIDSGLLHLIASHLSGACSEASWIASPTPVTAH